MLSYQHSYHAGCLADVHKHAFLSVLLKSLTQKDRPLSYLETHAGRGIYDLESEESLKTGEAQEGIKAIQSRGVFPEDSLYIKTLEKIQKRLGENIYAGSPAIAREILRPQDDLYLMELHPQEVRYLHRSFRDDNVHIHFRDGYEGALAVSPPKARRGLILIDPSYEIKTEYQDCVKFIEKIHEKWPEATIVLWYPMLQSKLYVNMIRALDKLNLNKSEHRPYQYADDREDRGMFGTGLYMINTPWGIDGELNEIENTLDKFISGQT